METRAHYVLIGAFMLASIILTLAFTLWLGSVDREFDEYDVIFTERVSGLSEGGAVLFNGIKVGEVRNLKLAPNDPTRVIARVRLSEDTPVKTDTDAELELSGITGLAVIQFTGGTPEAAMLKDVSDRRVPEVEASLSEIAKIIEGGGSIVANAQRLMSPENIDAASGIIADIKTLTGTLASKEMEIAAIVNNANTASADIAEIAARLEQSSEKIDSLLGTLESLVNGEAETTLKGFAEAAEDTSAVIKEIRALLNDNRAAIDAFAQQGLGQTSAAVADMRRLIQTTDGILREIERDPAKFFFGDGRPERKR